MNQALEQKFFEALESLQNKPTEKDLPGQELLFDLEDEDRVEIVPEAEKVARMMRMEVEAMLDCIDHMEMLVDDRRIVAELVARAMNRTGLLRKVRPLKNP